MTPELPDNRRTRAISLRLSPAEHALLGRVMARLARDNPGHGHVGQRAALIAALTLLDEPIGARA